MSYSSAFSPSSNPQFYPQDSQDSCSSYAQMYPGEYGVHSGPDSHTASIGTHPWLHSSACLTFDSAELSNNYLAALPVAPSIHHADIDQAAPFAADLLAHEEPDYTSTAYIQESHAFLCEEQNSTTSPSSYPDFDCGPASPASPCTNPDTSEPADYECTYSTLANALGCQTMSLPITGSGSIPPPAYTSAATTPEYLGSLWSDSGSESDVSSPSTSVYDALSTPPFTFESTFLSNEPSTRRHMKTKTTTRRNVRVTVHNTPFPVPSSADRWECPYCSYIQTNRRKPDLVRHINTHTSTDDEWVCCGVPFGDAELTKDIPAEMLREELFDYNGQLMVGGCRKTFSRRDALKRHLRAHKGVCFGSELAPYLMGNQIGAR